MASRSPSGATGPVWVATGAARAFSERGKVAPARASHALDRSAAPRWRASVAIGSVGRVTGSSRTRSDPAAHVSRPVPDATRPLFAATGRLAEATGRTGFCTERATAPTASFTTRSSRFRVAIGVPRVATGRFRAATSQLVTARRGSRTRPRRAWSSSGTPSRDIRPVRLVSSAPPR